MESGNDKLAEKRPGSYTAEKKSMFRCPSCRSRFRSRQYQVIKVSEKGQTRAVVFCPDCGMRVDGRSLLRLPKRDHRAIFLLAAAAIILNGILLFTHPLFKPCLDGLKSQWSTVFSDDYQQGMELYQEKRYEEAAACFQRGSGLFGTDPCRRMYSWMLVMGLGVERDPEQAEKLLDKVSRMDSYYHAVRAELIYCEIEDDLSEISRRESVNRALAEYQLAYEKDFPEPVLLLTHTAALAAENAQGCAVLLKISGAVLQQLDGGADYSQCLRTAEEKFAGEGTAGFGQEQVEDGYRSAGLLLWQTDGGASWDETALCLLLKGACEGDTAAMVWLSKLYSVGGSAYRCALVKEPNQRLAYQLAKAAHEQGDTDGSVLLARLTYDGIGTERDEEAARELVIEAGRAGNGAAVCCLGDWVSSNAAKITYYRTAWEKYHDPDGLERLAEGTLYGWYDRAQDEAQGKNMMLEAAQHGSAEAQMIYAGELCEAEDQTGRALLEQLVSARTERYDEAKSLLKEKFASRE